jgi:hypothetical protein
MMKYLVLTVIAWPEIMLAVLFCSVAFFIWGQVQPAKRRVALKAIWICAAFGVLYSLLTLAVFRFYIQQS